MSSVALVIVTVLLIIILLYIISILKMIRNIASTVHDATKELSMKLSEVEKYIEDSTAMRWILALAGKNKKKKRRVETV
jgi:predicted PurR-regulated permease PerM